VYAYAVEHPGERLDLAVAFSRADSIEAADAGYQREVAVWTRQRAGWNDDGVPAFAVPHVPADRPRHTEVPVRDFEAGITGGEPVGGRPDEQPTYLVVFTRDDDTEARLRAGMAYARLSVAVERLGLASSAMTQALDLPALLENFRTLMDWPDHPQMVLRVGVPTGAVRHRPTPRRSLESVLTIVD
jgi:hypothetical protein